MATSDTYTLVISDLGIPSSHATTHAFGGSDPITVTLNQVQTIAANTVIGNDTGSTAAPTALATTGTGNVVRASGATISLSAATGLPLTTGVTGILPAANGGTGVSTLGTGIATFLSNPTSANLKAAMTDEAGSGVLVFNTNTTLDSPTINGFPDFATPLEPSNGGTGVNSLGTGVATFLQTPSSANLLAAVTGETGIGALVFNDSPTLMDPTIDGTPTFSTPLSAANGGTGLSSLGTNVATFLGTPSSANLYNALTTSTGSGLVVFSTGGSLTNPVITNPILAAPLSVANGGTGESSKARGQCHGNYYGGARTFVANGTYQELTLGGAGSNLVMSNAVNVTLPTGNKATLRYTGSSTRVFKVSTHLSLDAGTNNDLIGIKLYKGPSGSHASIDATESRWQLYSTGSLIIAADMDVTWLVELAQNEEISIYISDLTGSRTLNVNSVKMVVDNIL